MAVKVGINGFGRIGRLVLRGGYKDKDLEFVAVNDITDAKTLAHLLKYDSIHGTLDAEVKATDDGIMVNGKTIKVLAVKEAKSLPWKDLGVEVVVESTGKYTDRAGASQHLEAGAKKVIISAPAKEPDVTIVLGVNEKDYDPAKHNIISNASCTTNCLAPVAKVLLEKFGIKHGFMTTIHAFTGDQRIVDSPHKDFRRAREAAASMIPTTTGAAKAVGLVLPQLKGKLNGIAIRVPTHNVSVVDLVVETEKETTKEEVNAALKAAAEKELKGIMVYSEEPLVSIDYNHTPQSSTVDALTTDVIDKNMVKVLAWYDNEWGYSCRVVDLIKYIAKK